MPNRFGRSPGQPAPFQPQGQLPDGLIPVTRPAGEAAGEISTALGTLATTVGKYADEATAIEAEHAGNVAGLDKAYRPTGGTSIRDKNFDEAATKTYLNNLSAEVQTRMRDTYEANKNSPAALKDGLDKLQQEFLAGDVFPDIEGKFRAAYAQHRLVYEIKARDNFDADQKDKARAALFNDARETMTTAAMAAAADPSDKQLGAVLEKRAQELDKLYDDAAKNDDISHEAAAKLKARARGTLAQTGILASAEKLDAAGVAALREKTRADFAKGLIKGLDAEWYSGLESSLIQLERSKLTAGKAAAGELSKRFDDHVARVADGQTPPPGEWENLVTAARPLPDGDRLVRQAEAKTTMANTLRGLSTADADRVMRDLRSKWRQEGGVDTERGQVLDFGEKYISDQRTALKTDLLGTAQKTSLIPDIKPLDFEGYMQTPDAGAAIAGLAGQFTGRVAQARAVADTLSRDPQFLRPEERERMKAIVDAGGDKALGLATAIVKGAGTDASKVLTEIGGEAPLLAQAGSVLAEGGSLSLARDVMAAAQIRQIKGGKIAMPDPQLFTAAVRDGFGAAFNLQGADKQRIQAAASAATSARLDRNNIDPKSSEAQALYKKTLQEAAGAVFVDGTQYGGVAAYKPGYWSSYQVPVPSGVKADAFRDVIRSIRDEDLAGLPVPPQTADGRPYRAQDVAGAVPIAVRGGYRFAMGDPQSADPKYIRGADGRPFVLPFEQLRGELIQRVPGAFLGGEH